MANDGDIAEAWMLTAADRTSVMAKKDANRLGFAQRRA
jgi:hypothetical protein